MFRQKENDRIRERYGPWAVVTGASSGIGRGIARDLAGCGLKLMISARRRLELEGLAAELRELGAPEVRVVPADLSAEAGIEAIEAHSVDLDVGLFVASAGFGTSGPLLKSPLETELNMLAVNCHALLSLTHHFGRRFVERGGGGLLLLSSIVAFQGVPRAGHYAATKAYVQSLAEALHHELAPHNVDVLAAAPGPAASGFAERANMQLGAAMPAEAVARPALRALGRRSTALPGLLTKFLVGSLSLLPRGGRVRVMSMVMGGMTAHQTQSASGRETSVRSAS